MAHYKFMTSPFFSKVEIRQTRSLVCVQKHSRMKVREIFLVNHIDLTICNAFKASELALALNSCPMGGPSPFQTHMFEA